LATASEVSPAEDQRDIFSVLRLIFAALGFACMDLFWLLKPAVEPTQRGAYHWSGNPNGLYLAALFDLLLLSLAILLLIGAARKPGRIRVAIWAGLILFTPWVLFMESRVLLHRGAGFKIGALLFWGALAATSLLVTRWRSSYAARFDRVVASVITTMIFLGAFGVFLSCRLVWYDWVAHHLNATSHLHHGETSAAPQPHRIIWIVFDELSYQQLFERRFPGLQMPAFDAFAAQATNFTQVVPIDINTEIVLPGLMEGISIDDIRTAPSGRLLMHTAKPDKWNVFDPHNTVFQDALNAGYSTGVAGWYNPYCRMTAAVLDQCAWVFRMPVSNGMSVSDSVLHNMVGPLNMVAWMLSTAGPEKLQRAVIRHRFPGSAGAEAQDHLADFEQVYAAANKLVDDPKASFILLHLPIPHPVGIYDRATGAVEPTGSYIDNLALADKCLANIHAELQQLGQWDSSTIVLMGDHSWRTKQLWLRRDFGVLWKREDSAASDGGLYDPRPAYMVKLPGQMAPFRVGTKYRAVNTRLLFDEILSHKITSPADLTAWAESVR
jgi:hypothetical protein